MKLNDLPVCVQPKRRWKECRRIAEDFAARYEGVYDQPVERKDDDQANKDDGDVEGDALGAAPGGHPFMC